ncbi:hypothetical protein M5C99_21390 [Acidovorax sp. NCPPB 2350]|nr:hypothetical protein M5C99_21390 [Acidovorax sp. NCPPB 2350]
MAIAIITGVLQELGPSVQETSGHIGSTHFSYLAFEDRRILRNVSVLGGLQGKLDAALDDEGPVELHLAQGGKKSDLVIALKGGDGRTFAVDLGGSSTALGYITIAGALVLGLFLLPLFGAGLLFWWLAWRTWHELRIVQDARAHVRGLAQTILI